jgi:molybdopterin/thiamine biosynthesis adenylyltransferase
MEQSRPRLKDYVWVANDSRLTLSSDAGIEIVIERPQPELCDLLLMIDGTHDIPMLTKHMQDKWPLIEEEDVCYALRQLDRMNLLEEANAPTILDQRQRTRFASNLAFFGTFASMHQSRFSFQENLCRARLLLLGVGGIGSAVLANLAGLGVGTVILVDQDRVELTNLTRQFLYSEVDIGSRKVDKAANRAQSLYSDMQVFAHQIRIGGTQDIKDLLRDVDLVICTIDDPDSVRSWVNSACVEAEIPFIVGGIWAQRGQYMSVSPGMSGCLECLALIASTDVQGVVSEPEAVNRGIGPMTSVLGGLMTLEALRYLTDFSSPVAAGRMWIVDSANGWAKVAGDWTRQNGCAVCSSPPRSGGTAHTKADLGGTNGG